MSPLEQPFSGADEVNVLQKKNETKEKPKLHPLQKLDEAPLVEKKVLVTHQVTIYPNQESMLDKKGGKVSRAVPALYYVIDAKQSAIETQIGLLGYHIGKSDGESIGWISTKECKDWSVPTAWSPAVEAFKDPPLLYNSLQTNSDPSLTEGINGVPMPKELYDAEYIFPVLKRKDGFSLIDRPLPSTIESKLTFPLWVDYRYRSEKKADGSSESFRDNDFMLLNKNRYDISLTNFTHLVSQWEKLKNDPDGRNESLALFQATQLAFANFYDVKITKNQLSNAEALSKTGSFVKCDFLSKTVDDVRIMDDGEFQQFFDSELSITLRHLQAAEHTETYSLRMNQQPTDFVRVPTYISH